MGNHLYCWGCGKTFGSYQSLKSHLGRCYWYRWFKDNEMLDHAPFHPDNLLASLEFMRGEPVPEDSIKLRYPKGHPKRRERGDSATDE